MAAEVPWHSPSPSFDAREAAREAARRAGLTLGAWVEQAIEDCAARKGCDVEALSENDKVAAIAARLGVIAGRDAAAQPRANVSTFAAPVRGKHARLIDAAARRVTQGETGAARLERHLAEIESALSAPRGAAASGDPLSPIETRLRRIADSLRSDSVVDRHDAIERLRTQIQELARAVSVLGKRSEAQIMPALKALLARVESERAKGRQDALAPVLRGVEEVRDMLARSPVRALQDDLAQIKERLDALTAASVDPECLASLQRDARNTARALALIAAQLPAQDRIEQQIAALSQRIDDIAQAPRDLAAHIVDLAQELRGVIEQADPSRALRALERRLEALAFQGQQAPQAMTAALQDVTARIDGLAEHPALQAIQAQVAELTSRVEELPPVLVRTLGELQQSVERAADRSAIDALEARIAELGARLASPPNLAETISEMRLSLERLAAQAGVRAQDEAIAALPGKIDALDEKVSAIRRRVDEAAASSVLLSRIDKLQAAVMTRLDDMQRAMTSAPAMRTEEIVSQLALRLDRAGSAPAYDPRALQALENQILRIAERLDRNGETNDSIAALERSISDLFAQVETARAAPAPAASDAPPAFAESFARDLRAIHSEAEGRTQATLHALQETLEKVVDRLALLEGDVGSLRHRKDAPAPPREPEILIEPGEPFTPPLPSRLVPARQEMAIELAEPRAAQKSFIAAARRASHMFSQAARSQSAAEPDAETQADPSAPRPPADKARAALLSLTGLIMLLGAFQVARAPGGGVIELAREPAPASPAAASFTSLLDPTPTGSIAAKRNSDLLVLAELADGGNPAAQYELGARLAEGRDTQRDAAKAAYWMQKAAEQNYAPAQFRLGSVFEKGQGVARSPRTAALWYGRAAEAGHVRAMHNLGVLLADGLDGKPDYAAAASMFRKAAEHGLRDSQYNLALLYMRGLGTEGNLAEAYKFFALAAAQGDAEAALKRDDVELRLPVKQLAEARAAAETFKLRKPDPIANEPASLETIVNAPRASDMGARQKIADRVTLLGQ